MVVCLHCDDAAWSRGLCQKHYNRLRRSGRVERINAVNTGECRIPGCPRAAFSKNLCQAHYQQARGPMRIVWQNLRSRARAGNYPPDWDDFDTFIKVVGDRPSEQHQLRRPNALEPWSAKNLEWLPPLPGEGFKANPAAYAKAWHIKNKYDLSMDDVEKMIADQNGLCFTCQRPLARVYPDTGKPVKICLDHHHDTLALRKVLCDPCNKGLGAFGEDRAAMARAIDYITHFEDPTNVVHYLPPSKRRVR